MKKLFFILFLSAISLQAQDGKHEKIKALKAAYITEKLALTSSEAEKFWPIYNSYWVKYHALKMQERCDIYEKLCEGIENYTDKEANEMIDKNLSIEASELELRKQLTVELRKVISPKKIILLKKTEDDFKRKLLERYRHGRNKSK